MNEQPIAQTERKNPLFWLFDQLNKLGELTNRRNALYFFRTICLAGPCVAVYIFLLIKTDFSGHSPVVNAVMGVLVFALGYILVSFSTIVVLG